jgi:hypothetical protein
MLLFIAQKFFLPKFVFIRFKATRNVASLLDEARVSSNINYAQGRGDRLIDDGKKLTGMNDVPRIGAISL